MHSKFSRTRSYPSVTDNGRMLIRNRLKWKTNFKMLIKIQHNDFIGGRRDNVFLILSLFVFRFRSQIHHLIIAGIKNHFNEHASPEHKQKIKDKRKTIKEINILFSKFE